MEPRDNSRVNKPASRGVKKNIKRENPISVVRGVATYADGQPATALLVKVFEVGLVRKTFLKDASTNPDGTYEVQYSIQSLDNTDNNTIGLLVEIYDPSERLLAASAIQYGLASSRTVNLVLPASERGPSEYERYLARLRPILRDVPLRQISREKDDHALTYLAEVSGVPRDRLEILVAAEQMDDIDSGARTESTASVGKESSSRQAQSKLLTSLMFYAWMRLGEERVREQILANPPARLIDILEKAGEENLIPVLASGDLEAIESSLLAAHTSRALQPSTDPQQVTLGDALNLLTEADVLSDNQKRLVAQLVVNRTSGLTAEDGFKAVRLSDAQTGTLRQIVALHQLSEGDGALLVAAHRYVRGKSDGTMTLPLHAVAGLDESDWQSILNGAKTEKTDSPEIEKTAKRVVERTAQLFPNAFLFSRLMQQPDSAQLEADLKNVAKLQRQNKEIRFNTDFSKLQLKGIGAGDRRNLRSSFGRTKELVNRYPGLELQSLLAGDGSVADNVSAIQKRVGLIGAFLTANPDRDLLALDYVPDSPDLKELKFPGMQDAEKAMVLRNVKAHWRAFRMTGNALKAQTLMAAGFHSATVTANATLEEFINATNLPTADAAKVHAEASDIALNASLHYMAAHSLLQPIGKGSSNPIHSIAQPPEIVNHLKRFDGFKDLFGAQTICRCQHCRSVLGPAAYFVDLMRFIDKNITERVFDNNPQADQTLRLRYRRPDLWVLPLTCENSDTLIPTLNVVNEILENFIEGERTPAADQRSRIQKDVYLKLTQAKDSFKQPCVLPLKQVETYLSHFQLTRAQISQALELDDDTIARASLGISLVERDLIVNVGTNDQLDKLFGLAITTSNTANTQLFLALDVWTRSELGQVLKTQFVQGGNAITIQSGKTSAASVQNDRETVTGYSRAALDRLHRFSRMWLAIQRSIKWSIAELDLVLSNLASLGMAPTVTSTTLANIAKLLAVQKQYGVTVEQSCALFVDIPITNLGKQPSLFDRLFNLDSFVAQDGLWPAVTPQGPPIFHHPSSLPANAPDEEVLSNSKLTQRLMAGMQVDDEELIQLMKGLGWFINGVALSLPNLTLLYRHSLLARGLKTAIPELFQLLAIGKVPASRVSDLAGLLQLMQVVADWRESVFTIDDLVVITGGSATDLTVYPDAAMIANAVADQVRTGRLLEFAATVLAEVQGIISEQSKTIVLQNATVFETAPQSENFRLLASADPNANGFVLNGIPQNSLSDVIKLLNRYHTRAVLEKLLAAQFNLTAGAVHQLSVMCGNLLTTHNANLNQELYGNGQATVLKGIVARFIPLVVLFKNKVWEEDQLKFVATQPGVFGLTLPLFAGAPPDTVTFFSALKVASYAQLVGVRDEGFSSEQDLPDSKAVQTVLTDGFGDDGFVAKALRVPSSRVSQLKTYLSLDPAKPFQGLRKLAQAISLTDLLGLGGAALASLIPATADPTTEFQRLTDAADALLAVFRTKYPDERTFAQNQEPYEDILRTRKRDGLVEYLIRSMNRGFVTTSDLYQFFLIDTQVEGCARTARLVAAHGSLQLYVQRVLMNLERSGPDDANEFNVLQTLASLQSQPLVHIQSEWEWRRTYRVWEANRKVFLYPESYLEPELRDDKTPPFKDMESTLLQQRINEENATNAYTQYLEDYEEAASLKIAGAYHQIIDTDPKMDRLHLFGATSDEPPVYYYRTIDNVRFAYEGKRKSYTPWRKLNVQIPVREVCPVIYQGRLLIFWVQITTIPNNKVEKGESRFVGYQHKFTFNYSEKRANDTWTPPQKLTAFNSAGLPFERLDDPLEEPLDAQLASLLGKEITAGQLLVDDLTKVNSYPSETLFMPVVIMDSQNPNNPKMAPVPGSQPVQMAPVFKLVRVSPNPHGGYTPRYDVKKRDHFEPVDGYTLTTPAWTRIHAEIQGTQLFLTGMDTNNLLTPITERKAFVGRVDLFERTVTSDTTPGQVRGWTWLVLDPLNKELWREFHTISSNTVLFPSTTELLGMNSAFIGPSAEKLGDVADYSNAVVVNKAFPGGNAGVAPDAIVDFKNDLVMFLMLDGLTAPAHDKVAEQALTGTALERLGTTIRRELRRQLFGNGLGGLLSYDYQYSLKESGSPINAAGPDLLVANDLTTFSFDGPFGVYFQEIFFHIPFLIANNLNSQQRFAAAQRWYHYIFYPASSDAGANRVWQYRKFKEELRSPDNFRKELTDSNALNTYRRDPFNPHAIARLRPGSYQKTIVMKYIDNLLDWGDTLFVEFTMESLNEATMLYVLAADILGPRAVEVGDCGEASADPLTYEDIRSSLTDTSDFLIELEHLVPVPVLAIDAGVGESLIKSLGLLVNSGGTNRPLQLIAQPDVQLEQQALGASVGLMDFAGSNGNPSSWRSAGGTDLRSVRSYGDAQNPLSALSPVRGLGDPYEGARVFLGGDPINPPGGGFPLDGGSIPQVGGLLPFDYTIPDNGIVRPGRVQPATQRPLGGSKFPPHDMVREAALPQPVFCIPPNADLMAYWDRVEDRLYKIRNCMDISGARRLPSLYAPELDPRQLVKGKAAGLPLDDVLNGITGDVPPYRFTFIVDKAKQYVSTVQSFGNALLSALEKKDAEQLSRLRAVQEQNLLKLRNRVLELEIEAAEDTQASLERQGELLELRQTFYESMLQNGLISWERTQQVSRHIVSTLHQTEATVWLMKAVLCFLPQLGAPTAMKYGGLELSGAAAGFASISQALAQVSEAVSASAGLEATFQRRDEDWRQQKKLADKELENVSQQIKAAKARVANAQRALEVHNKSADQAEEIFQFYRDKFSSFGLYTLHSAQLQRSYREAYNCAFAVAKMAEQAYRYEREYDLSVALRDSYWAQDQAGLLAGEQLLIDLQNLERRFHETNYRALELEQSFSLMQVNPSALMALRESGACTFALPEVFFNLVYPGHYRRRIKGVRLTIPCVVGPYTSVGATLQLNESWIQDYANSQQSRQCSLRHNTTVAMSTAQNDSGTFEFNFRDERYMPFEGLGAVDTKWELRLPATFRTFDYRTISDAILRISYTAEEDSTLRTTVEDLMNGSIKTYLKDTGISRIFSLRHEFPDVWNQLVRSPLNTVVNFEISDRHLPYLFSYLTSLPPNKKQSLASSAFNLLLQTKVDVGGIAGPSFDLNGATVETFQSDPTTGLPGQETRSGQPAQRKKMQVAGLQKIKVLSAGALAPQAGQPGAIDDSKLEDILLRVTLQLQ